jgi:hypothetical protein
MKIILTESQFKVLQEAVGVPEGILQAGEELYNIVSDELKSIDSTEEKYEFEVEDKELTISDVTFDNINIEISVEEVEDFPYEHPMIASMGVGNEFNFDEGVMLQVNAKSSTIDLVVNFIAPEGWEPEDLYKEFTKDKEQTVSVMSHEIMHRFHRQKQEHELIGGTADYNVYSSGGLRFGIPVINDFMRYSYFIQHSENVVRPTEIASRMMQKGIKKQDFYDFMVNDEVFTELKRIREFSYDYLMERLYEEMDSVDELISHAGGDPDSMNDEEKIKSVLELVYINLVNAKVDTFDNFFYSHSEKMAQMFGGGGLFSSIFGQIKPPNEEKEKVRRKFINHVSKYKNREMDFFVDECERFNYVATNLMKKISKIYALLPDEKEQTNESILDWELHQKIMEKRYGKRPIQTSYNFKK